MIETEKVEIVETEKVYDILPSFATIYDKLDIDGWRKRFAAKVKGEKEQDQKEIDSKSIGLNLFKYILKNSAKVKSEIFEMVAVLEGKTAEEVRKQDFRITISTLNHLFSDKETMDFLSSAVK